MRKTLPDIDTLREMALNDPAQLEQLRRNLAQQVIDQAAPRNRARLQGLQFEIDAHCRSATNPVAACVKLSTMLRTSFERLHATLNIAREAAALDFDTSSCSRQGSSVTSEAAATKVSKAEPHRRSSATIIEFKPRRPAN